MGVISLRTMDHGCNKSVEEECRRRHLKSIDTHTFLDFDH